MRHLLVCSSQKLSPVAMTKNYKLDWMLPVPHQVDKLAHMPQVLRPHLTEEKGTD